VGAVEIGEVEKLYRQELNKTMGDLNNKTFILNNNQTAIGYCTAFKLLSELFECCGVNGPNVKEALENRVKTNSNIIYKLILRILTQQILQKKNVATTKQIQVG
jgi:hypothetical protein